MSIEELCLMEAIYEQMEKGSSDGTFCISQEQVNAKLREKRRELKKTGKVTTTVPPGTFGEADVIQAK